MTISHEIKEIAFQYEGLNERLTSFLDELPQEFHSYVVEGNYFPIQFLHPFCHVLCFDVMPTSVVVETIADLSRCYEKGCANGEFQNALCAVVKPYRREYLLNLINEHGVERLYPAIRSVWIGVDWFWEDYWTWLSVWSAVQDEEGGCRQVIHPEERETFDALPETLTVYRGFQRVEDVEDGEGGEEYGWSWSLSKEQAEWFARRWPGGIPTVATLTVPKNAVLAYFNDRNEEEIVLLPDDLASWLAEDITVEELSREREAA